MVALPLVGHILVVIFALAAALVLMVVRTFVEFNGAAPTLLLVGLLVVYTAWKVVALSIRWSRRSQRPTPITRPRFLEVFQMLDDKLYSGQLHREGVTVYLADDISPNNPFVYRLLSTPDGKVSGETCTEAHGYSPTCRAIVVSRNQSNEAIMKGLITEMRRAANYYRELYKFMAPAWERGAKILDELDKLLKRSDTEQRTEEIIKLLDRWPKAQ
jgi:hypothetical protein